MEALSYNYRCLAFFKSTQYPSVLDRLSYLYTQPAMTLKVPFCSILSLEISFLTS